MNAAESRLSDKGSEKVIRVDNEMGDSKKSESPTAVGDQANKPMIRIPSLVKKKESSMSSLVLLEEDIYGKFIDENGAIHNIQRFTWKNANKLEVQVISYGARIVAMKMPDQKGFVEDIVLGFNDFAGYYHYKDYYMGATIGRMTNRILDATFVADGKQYFVSANRGKDHYNGGFRGLDQVIWKCYQSGKKVVMSYISPQCSEGYPGDVLVRITFELSSKNDFRIVMEAQSTKPTIINLSNLVYFNLAGHHMGPTEVYKHMLTLNCNCFTPMKDNKPTGIIQSVVNTQYDFQVPKLLGSVMGIVPKDGFNQNFCVNRGCAQDLCFVARAFHPKSGRILEVYSNQPGVQFRTANEFGYGDVMPLQNIVDCTKYPEQETNEITETIELIKAIHIQLMEVLKEDYENDFADIVNLIIKLKTETTDEESIRNRRIVITQLQQKYLKAILDYRPPNQRYVDEEEDDDEEQEETILSKLQTVIKKLFAVCEIQNDVGMVIKNKFALAVEEISQASIKKPPVPYNMRGSTVKHYVDRNVLSMKYVDKKKIQGKHGAIYRMHSGIALQTQNYPCCANFKSFPSCQLKPDEVYRHKITYKFWIRSGNPTKWVKRNLNNPKS